MTEHLLPLLLLLTLLDLAFVQATGAVDNMYLVPMLVLTLAAPWLRHLQRRVLHRGLWNGGVLLVFGLIVQHATTTGLVHMLEDGLALAVLCQVHLLNNVGARQRPDLVFFNSLLIAFVTSLFAPDISWSVLFVVHAFVLVPSLELHAVTRANDGVTARECLRIVRASVPRAVAVVGVTALAFLACPRDFHRQGWFNELLAQQQFATGIAERIDLDHETALPLSDAVVAQIVPMSGTEETVPAHWRATAFTSFDGSSWLPQDASELGSRFATDLPWNVGRDGAWYRDLPNKNPQQLRVRLLDSSLRRLPSPLSACRIELQNGAGLLLDPRSYAVLGVMRLDDAPAGSIDYVVDVTTGTGAVVPSQHTRQLLTALPELGVPQFMRDLSAQLRLELPPDTDELTVARHMCDWLQQHRRYNLPGAPGFARNLGEFLIGSAGGHCEYFATALAMLLRSSGLPCRLVGGYLAHEWDANAKAVIVRSKDAHAWVEVLSAQGQWVTLDATPPADVRDGARPTHSWWAEMRADLERMWANVTGFDGERQSLWLRRLMALPRDHALLTASILATILFGLRHRRRRRTLPVIDKLHRAARAAGVSLRLGETPRELLVRAEARQPENGAEAAKPLTTLRAAAHDHELDRYRERTGCPS